MKSFFFLISVISFNLLNSQTPEVAKLTGNFTVTDAGSAMYSIPITLPPGIGGMKPDLALNYSSNGINGLLGIGFGFSGLSVITRGAKTIEQDGLTKGMDFTYDDAYYLDGERLVLWNEQTEYGKDGAQYGTESNSFMKIISKGVSGNGPDYFEAFTKTGLKLTFGKNSNNKVYALGSQNVLYYLLEKIEEFRSDGSNSNYMLYEYEKEEANSSYRPKRIRYTFNDNIASGSNTAINEVVFIYNDRSDISTGYLNGLTTGMTKKLTELQITHNNVIKEKYSFTYIGSGNNSILLSKVEHCMVEDNRCSDPLVFSWDNGNTTLEFSEKPNPIPTSAIQGENKEIYNQDLNNDGLTDIIIANRLTQLTLEIYLNGGNANFSKITHNIQSATETSALNFVDVNSDGFIDLLVTNINGGNSWYVNNKKISTSGAIFNLAPTQIPDSSLDNSSTISKQYFLIDFNGDSRLDFLIIDVLQGTSELFQNDSDNGGLRFNKRNDLNIGISVSAFKNYHLVPADFDNDGKTDILFHRRLDQETNGHNFIYKNIYVPGNSEIYQLIGEDLISRNYFKTDAISASGNAAQHASNNFIFKEKHKGGCQKSRWPLVNNIGFPQFADVNGDNLVDIIMYQFHSDNSVPDGANGVQNQEKMMYIFINKGNFTFEAVKKKTSEEIALGLSTPNYDGFSSSTAQCYLGYVQRVIAAGTTHSCGDRWYGNLLDPTSSEHQIRDNISHFVDLNGDGKSDMISTFRYSGSRNGFAQKMKNDFYTNINLNSNKLLCEENTKLTTSFEDFQMSFGRFYKFGTDIFITNKWTGKNSIFRNLADGKPPVISHFDGQLGGNIYVTYASLNDNDVYTKGTKRSYPDIDFASSALVVKNFQISEIDLNDDTWVNPKTIQDISYKYFDGVMNLTGRGFRGYKKLEITDNLKGFKTVKEFEEDSRLIAANLKSQKTYASNGVLLSEEEYKNVQWRTYSDGSGQIDTFFVIYNTNFQDKIYTPYPAEIISKTYDLNGKMLVTNKSRQYIDAFGNLIYQVFEYGDGCIDSIYHEYINDWDKWFIGRLVKSTVYKSCPGQITIIRESAFEYNENTGLLVKEVLEPNQNDQIKTEKIYEHDKFGNITKTTEKAWDGTQVVSRTKSAKYDAIGRFQIESINQAGHKVSLKVDPYRGLPIESTDENGLVTKMKYNSLGILRETEFPDGTKSFVNSEKLATWTENVGMKMNSKSTQSPESNMVMGLSGSKYSSEITLFNGSKSASKNYYDTQYRLESNNNKISSKRFEYDIAGRITLIAHSPTVEPWEIPFESITTLEYDGLSDKVINPLGQQMVKLKDVRQRLIKSIDNATNEVKYRYDVQGQLAEIIVGDNEYKIQYEYDLRGRMTAMVDPVLGREEFTYDGFNNLLSKKDGAGNVTIYTYDILNRVKTITQAEGVISYTYDQGNKAIGKTNKVTYPNFESNIIYDNIGRLSQNTIIIGSTNYIYKYHYNSIGKLDRVEHPSGIILKYHYNNQFYLYKVTNNQSGKLIWELNETDVKNRPTKITSGNGIVTEINYDFRDNVISIKSSKNNDIITDLSYDYNEIRFKVNKNDSKNNIQETYEYDNLNRLIKVITSGITNKELLMTYDKWGNITSKSDLGTYTYNKDIPTLLEKIDFINKDCDLPSSKFDYEYTSFNKIKKITGDSVRLEIEYGPNNQRLVQKIYIHDQLKETRTYISGDYEILTINNIETKRFSISSPAGFTVVYETIGNQTGKYQYLHKDDQGTIIAITNDQAKVEHTYLYDVWGKRLIPNSNDIIFGASYRGYTGHEHISILELINMNGRIYDPIMARFISPDPYIQDQTNFQNFNRFSYVYNNPINYIDPSGYSVWDDIGDWGEELLDEAEQTIGRISSGISNIANGNVRDGLKSLGQAWIDIQIKWASGGKVIDAEGRKQFGDETWNQIVVASATIVVGIATGGTGAAGTVTLTTAIMSGMAAGATGGALSAYLAGGGTNDILKAGFRGGVIGGISAGLTYGVGSGMDAYYGQKGMQTFAGESLRAIGHGAVQGTMNELQGGKFSQGFFTGMVSSIGSHSGNLYGTNPAIRVFSASIVGGSISSITGGKFATGAVTGAFVEMYNQNAHKRSLLNEIEDKYNSIIDKANEIRNSTEFKVAQQVVKASIGSGLILVGVSSELATLGIGTPGAAAIILTGAALIADSKLRIDNIYKNQINK